MNVEIEKIVYDKATDRTTYWLTQATPKQPRFGIVVNQQQNSATDGIAESVVLGLAMLGDAVESLK